MEALEAAYFGFQILAASFPEETYKTRQNKLQAPLL
jgi:hypothetical protein